MKKYKRIFLTSLGALFIGAVMAGAGVLASTAEAQSVFKSDDTIAQTEEANGPFFGAGSSVQISENVDGDVYVAGQNVVITGDVAGDVIVATQTLTISGAIDGDVRAIAQSVTVTGEVKGSISGVIQALVIEENAVVARDMALVGQSVTIDGIVGRDVNGLVEELYVNGTVGRDINYMSETDFKQSNDAVVGGTVTRTDVPRNGSVEADDTTVKVVGFIYSLAASIFAVLLATLIIPRWLKPATDRAFPAPWQAMLAGLLAAVLVPIALIVLALTVIGIPVAIFGIFAYIVFIALGFVFTSYYTGRLVMRNQNIVLQGLVGVVIYSILLAIPVIGFIAWVAGSLIGTGIIALDVWNRLTVKAKKAK